MPKKKSKKKTKTRELPPGGGGDKTGELPPGGGGDKSDALQLKDSVKHHRMDEIKSLIDSYNYFLDNFVDKYLDTFNTEDIGMFDSTKQLILFALKYIYKGNSLESINGTLKYINWTEDLVKIIQDKNSLLQESDIGLLKHLKNEMIKDSSSISPSIHDLIPDIYVKLLSLESPDHVMDLKNKRLTEITIKLYINGDYSQEQTINKLLEIFKIESNTNIDEIMNEIMDEFDKKYKSNSLKVIINIVDLAILSDILMNYEKIIRFPEVILRLIEKGNIENAKGYLGEVVNDDIPNYQSFSHSRANSLWRKTVDETYILLEEKINLLLESGDIDDAKRLLNNFLNLKDKEFEFWLYDKANIEGKIRTKIQIAIDKAKIDIYNATRKATEMETLLLQEEEKEKEKKVREKDSVEKHRLQEQRVTKNESKKFFNQVIDNIIDNTIQQSESKAEQKALIEKVREEEEKASRVALQVKVKQEREKAAKQVKEKAKKQRQKAARALRKEEVEQSVLAEEARMIYNTKTPTMYENPPSLYQLGIAYPLDEFIPMPPDEPPPPNDQEPLDEYYKSLKELSLSYPIPKPTEEEIERIKSRIGSTNLSAAAEPFIPDKAVKPITEPFVQKQGGRSKKKTKRKKSKRKSRKSIKKSIKKSKRK